MSFGGRHESTWACLVSRWLRVSRGLGSVVGLTGGFHGRLLHAGHSLGFRALPHVGVGLSFWSSSMSTPELIGYLMGAWGVGFAMGHILKFFRRLVEMS